MYFADALAELLTPNLPTYQLPLVREECKRNSTLIDYRKEHAGAKFQAPVKITPLSRRFGNGPSYRCDVPVGTRGYFWLQCDA